MLRPGWRAARPERRLGGRGSAAGRKFATGRPARPPYLPALLVPLMENIPLVSVIVPNYNHAPYLAARLDSILAQTYPNFELIILDDRSRDTSAEVIGRYAQHPRVSHVILNTENSGSTFKQWNKGFGLAQGKYVWLAESDDYADKSFLRVLVGRMEADASLGLAYCDSWDVDEHDKVLTGADSFYDDLDPVRWSRDFTAEGKAMIGSYLCYKNIIPNASAVLLRRAVLQAVGPADETFRVNGDWIFWARMLAVSNVCFVAERLNYFRRHTANVRSVTTINGLALLEAMRVVAFIQQVGVPDPYFFNKILDFLVRMWFTGVIEYDIPLTRHKQILRGFRQLDPHFRQRFRREFARFMLPNKLSGLRQLLGDGLVYRLLGVKRRR